MIKHKGLRALEYLLKGHQIPAEAAALKAQKQEITPELLRLREIESQNEAIKKWDGHLPSTNAGGSLPFLNIGK